MEIDAAEAVLRPSAAALAAAWRELVQEEAQQVERLPDRPRPEDFYAPVAERFRADPDRTDDAVLNALIDLARPDETWLDVGAGAGRYTLGIARQVQRVIAIEPSAGMRGQLAEATREHGIENLDTFAERWPCPSGAPVADVGFFSNVGHDIAEFGAFLDQVEAHSRRLCIAAMFDRAPISDFAPLWQPVHGVRRVLLPALRELVALLFARGRTPELRLLRFPGRIYEDLAALHQTARRPLWVLEGSEPDQRLAAAVRELAIPDEGGFRLGPPERVQGIVSWRPA
jgi:SAM-dependent methyltransferase